MWWILLGTSAAGLYWIYDGYGRFLQLACVLQSAWRSDVPQSKHVADRSQRGILPDSSHWSDKPTNGSDTTENGVQLPSMAVLITAHNEAHNIVRRIENLLSCDYPADRLQIVVAADGCTDQTCSLVRQAIDQRRKTDPMIRLYESSGLGKSATQNGAMADIDAEVVVFTDADVVFDHQFLWSAGQRFLDPAVGAVAGHLLFAAPGEDAVVTGQGFFWQYELKLRRLETRLGLLAVVAGSCFSVRRRLFVPMDASVGDDCIVPLDVVSQGCRVIQDETAVCYDQFEYESDVVLRKRIRMTLRNWQGTWMRPALLNPLRNPRYAFALWSHKILRWLSPVFLLLATVAAVAITVQKPASWKTLTLIPFVGLYSLAAVGWLRAGATGLPWIPTFVRQQSAVLLKPIPGAGTAFSFVLVNLAFLLGVSRALLGYRIQSYRNFLGTEPHSGHTQTSGDPTDPTGAGAAIGGAIVPDSITHREAA